MKKNFLLILGILLSLGINAQIGVNTTTPHSSAALDVESTNQGVLLPRMATSQKRAIVSPASGLLVYDTTLKCISQNVGTATVPQWVCLSQKDNQSGFFYMPSIVVDASTLLQNKTLDLYAEYKKQFATPTVRSENAPVSIPYFPIANELYYYITYYDSAVLKINSLNASGVMNYDIIKEADYASFMNVVFVIK
ncbi:hypothetical protein CLV62_102223 [Dysgonomonas alginatilytica]|uniref:SH3 domain-containing protein n=1 Tax=Dysgonomonas alginatilytica TaxID=1605892 RepID=A0A2V3PV70_9BACT|nr:hypothetical protein [Dysgonomonas alginatilytica]PXV68191.1 hypothetical protein CLV62_102223 [Dysgonomonas alginatilytica]